ncbi:MAG TPA: tetratricopeptide repeat protein [Tepidisphaeraceae bacterium]|jgi:tetratricopeptide (TPR) repeat protein|nr:tetratricopeptide repeat protein [Tepidisphaeraceae bacterium]
MTQFTIDQAMPIALQHHQAGRLAEAEAIYCQVLAGQPNHPDALHLLGDIALQTGRLDMAIVSIRRAVAANPGIAEFHNSLGNALNEKKLFDEAITALRRAIQIKPAYAEAQNNLGISLRGKGLLDESIAAYRQAIAFSPKYAEAHSNLGNALKDQKKLDEAIAAFHAAIALNPKSPEVHNNLGVALRQNGQLAEAVAAYQRALALRPNHAETHSNLGVALRDQGQLNEAIAAYEQAIALRPSYAEAHYNLSLALLARGDLQQGWDEYDWRGKCEDISPPRNFTRPPWDGCPLEGRTILLYTEQGFGDALQFVRYLPLVARRGGKIIVGCQAELQRLFQTAAAECQIVVPGEFLPPFDFHCSLLSLLRVFGTTLANIPNIVPYLRADAEDIRRWQQRLANESPLVNVGLAWAGSPRHKNDRNRSTTLARLAPLGEVPGVRFVSLQKGEPAIIMSTAAAESERKISSAGLQLVDWTQELKDFGDTAGLIANLDLVIAVDTAVAHLAGAMGKPVWTLLPFAPDWRWMLEREDSPWYPTMRLFRQKTLGDWKEVIDRVARALSDYSRVAQQSAEN